MCWRFHWTIAKLFKRYFTFKAAFLQSKSFLRYAWNIFYSKHEYYRIRYDGANTKYEINPTQTKNQWLMPFGITTVHILPAQYDSYQEKYIGMLSNINCCLHTNVFTVFIFPINDRTVELQKHVIDFPTQFLYETEHVAKYRVNPNRFCPLIFKI